MVLLFKRLANKMTKRYHSALARVRPKHSNEKSSAGALKGSSAFKSPKKRRKSHTPEPENRFCLEETTEEAEHRGKANFGEIEERIPADRPASEMPKIAAKDKLFSRLGRKNPLAKAGAPDKNRVIVFDNFAYRPVKRNSDAPQGWQAEYTACFFSRGKHDVSNLVGSIADIIGVDGRLGVDESAQAVIVDRIAPFAYDVAPARSAQIEISQLTDEPLARVLGPSNAGGLSHQIECIPGGNEYNGKTITNSIPGFDTTSETYFASPEGWGIISDVDDTIKITQTTSPVGILKTTFADDPQPISGMPELYNVIHDQFKAPAWFYLSASPYQLYPFLRQFVRDSYHPGPLLLREDSWMQVGGLLQSLTTGTKNYKQSRIERIHACLPQRRFICIGDSTQSDPEVYAHAYRKHPDWIRAIYIRKVTDVDHMEAKNTKERFEAAFTGVPSYIWRVFEQPEDLAEHLAHVAGDAHIGLVGKLQAYFCKDEQAMKAAAATPIPAIISDDEAENA